MNAVCLCLDLEGFHVAPRFHVRELGWCDHTGRDYGCVHFDPNLRWNTLTPQQRRRVRYVTQHIHGLSLYPRDDQEDHPTLPAKSLHSYVQDLYRRHATSERNVVAYKGGRVERDLLESLHIPSLDLEAFGCPKFNDMLRLTTAASCGQHVHNPHAHCAQVECYHFIQWMRGQCGLPRDMNFINQSRYNRFVNNNNKT